ncbi:hypothetical protein M405DRAFT_811846, partial [Rhizopogon salebrosus TDB-379]
PLGGVIPIVMVYIQSGHIFYTVTVALVQTASSTAYEGNIRLLHQALLNKISGGVFKYSMSRWAFQTLLNQRHAARQGKVRRVNKTEKSKGSRAQRLTNHRQDALWEEEAGGRSYFVNHNTRTTSWKKPVPDRPAGSLTSECIIEGHSECIWSLACVGTGCNIMSASDDGSIRQWIRDGEPVGEPWKSDGGG